MKLNTRIIFLGIASLLLSTLYITWVWTSDITDFGGDSSGYLLAARYYSPYQHASASVIAYKSQIIYPPLFPLLLAVVNGGYDLLAAHLAVSALALGGIAMLYVWLRKELLPHSISSTVALIYAAMPATYLQVLNIWTEFSFIFFCLSTIGILSKADKNTSHKIWMAAAFMVACATLTRIAALPLLVAFLFFIVIHRPHHAKWIALTSTVPIALWALYSSHTETGASAYVGHWAEKYASGFWLTLAHQLQIESRALLHAWSTAWLGNSQHFIFSAVVDGFGLICGAGWIYRLIAKKFDAIYVMVYVCMLLAWPHPEEATRYSFVIFPILIAYGFLILSRVVYLRYISMNYPLTAMYAALLSLAMLPTLLMNMRYFMEHVDHEFDQSKHIPNWYSSNRPQALQDIRFHTRLIRHLNEIGHLVPEKECIFSIKPTVITLYTDRRSYAPPKMSATPTEFGKHIHDCRFAYLLPFTSPSFSTPLYPFKRLGKHAKIISLGKLYDSTSSSIVGALIEITD